MKLRRNRFYISNTIMAHFSSLFLSKRRLKKYFQKELNLLGNFSNINYFLNGRSAIYSILNHLRRGNKSKTVLIPYRLCNVISMACTKAGFKVVFYRSPNQLKNILRNSDESLVIIQGSTHLSEIYVRPKKLDEHFYLYDECQRFTSKSLSMFSDLKSNEYVTYSFNDKVIPGIMGGISLSKDSNFNADNEIPRRIDLLFWVYSFKDFCKYLQILPKSIGLEGEFSLCKGTRYQVECFDIAKLSLGVGLHWFKRLKEVENLRTLQWNSIASYTGVKYSEELPYAKLNIVGQEVAKFKNLKAPYLKYQSESINSAIEDGGHFAIINSVKYHVSE